MKENRIAEIRNRLMNHGPVAGECYTNPEIIDHLVDLQEAMAREVFALGHAEHFAARDIMIHFGALAEEYGLTGSDEYRRLAVNMKTLGYTIGSLKKGATGEKRTREGLRVMNYDPQVRILYNITLQDDGSKTEYDAIVITTYGIFVVEAKNFRGTAHITEKGMLQRADDAAATYNLGERMNNKEYLLKSCLGDLAGVPYQGLLLYVDESADIVDDYKQIPIIYCNTVATTIRSYNHGEQAISPEDVLEIERRLQAHHTESRYPCRVDCEQIIADFARLISAIEEKADVVNLVDEDEKPKSTQVTSRAKSQTRQDNTPTRKHHVWPKVAGGFVLGLVGGIFLGKWL